MYATKDAKEPGQDLLIGDLTKYLTRWASVQRDERMGNPALSEGLTLLAACLKRHASRPVCALAELQLQERGSRVRRMRKPAIELSADLDSLEWDQVSAILDSDPYLKKQLTELGERRLGIPRGSLSRMKRAEAIASIRAALDHERSLVAIERQARLAGERRTA